jgi:hypothetical protein
MDEFGRGRASRVSPTSGGAEVDRQPAGSSRGGASGERGRQEESVRESEWGSEERGGPAVGLTLASRAEWAGLLGQVGQVQPSFSRLAK